MIPLLLLVMAAAAVLRFWALGDVGISHWDAGSFTAGPFGIGPYGKGYILPFYAPPLVPTLNFGVLELVKRTDTVAIALAATLGTLTIPVLYRFGAQVLGRAPALIAAAALAGMEYHVIFSRQPLTDVPFTLFYIATLSALWTGWRRGERMSYLVAGVAAGACLMTKYHGFFTLVTFAGLLLATAIPGLVRDPERPTGGWSGLAVGAGVMAIPALWLAYDIGSSIGFDVFRENRSQWLPEIGPWVIPQTARFLFAAFTRWTSWLVLVPAALGFGVMVVRRRPGDVLILAWVLLFVVTLPFYAQYPRLLVPLLPPLALAAGQGLTTLSSWIRRSSKAPAPLAVAVLAAIPLVGGALETAPALTVSDRGYARAAEWLKSKGRADLPDLLLTQHSILFYMADAPNAFLAYDEAETAERLATGRFRYAVFDLRALKAPGPLAEAIEEWSPHMNEIENFDNPLPEPFVVNLMGFEALETLRDGESDAARDLTTIRIEANRIPNAR